MSAWTWLSNGDNQRTLAFIGAGIAGVVALLVQTGVIGKKDAAPAAPPAAVASPVPAPIPAAPPVAASQPAPAPAPVQAPVTAVAGNGGLASAVVGSGNTVTVSGNKR